MARQPLHGTAPPPPPAADVARAVRIQGRGCASTHPNVQKGAASLTQLCRERPANRMNHGTLTLMCLCAVCACAVALR